MPNSPELPEQKSLERSAIERVLNIYVAASLKEPMMGSVALAELMAFVSKFKEEVPDWPRYKLFQALFGSTPGPNDDLFDHTGELSVHNFSEDLVKRHHLEVKE